MTVGKVFRQWWKSAVTVLVGAEIISRVLSPAFLMAYLTYLAWLDGSPILGSMDYTQGYLELFSVILSYPIPHLLIAPAGVYKAVTAGLIPSSPLLIMGHGIALSIAVAYPIALLGSGTSISRFIS